jgi:hypothetical protein
MLSTTIRNSPVTHRQSSPLLVASERGAPLSAAGFSRPIERAAVGADLGIEGTSTCSAMPAVISSPTTGMVRARSKPIRVIATFRNDYTALAPQRFRNFFETKSI